MQGLEKTLMASERASEQSFFGFSALLFAVTAVLTTVWSASMSAMGEMPMPGGWTMSDGVDADARTDVAKRGGVVPRNVDRDDGGDDAAVLRPNRAASEKSGHQEPRHDKSGRHVAVEAAKPAQARVEAPPKKKGLAGISRIPVRRG